MSPHGKTTKGSKGQAFGAQHKSPQAKGKKDNILTDIMGSEVECSDTISGAPSLATSMEEVNSQGGEGEVVSTQKEEAKEESKEGSTSGLVKTPDDPPDKIIDELTLGMSAEDLEDLSSELAEQREQDRRKRRKGKFEM
eukprot:797177-Pyramimonas_sp.AAC.1